MKKRTITIVLCALLLLTSVKAAAVGEVTFGDNLVTISGETPTGEGYPVTVSVTYQGEVFYRNEILSGRNGFFEFKFKMLPEDQNGIYKVNIGGAGFPKLEKSFVFTGNTSDVSYLEFCGVDTVTDMKTLIDNKGESCGIDINGRFSGLSVQGKESIYEALCDRVYTSAANLFDAFDSALNISVFNEGTSEAAELVAEYGDSMGFAVNIYEKLINRDNVNQAVIKKGFPLTDPSVIRKAFDTAAVLSFINQSEDADFRDILSCFTLMEDRGYGLVSFGALTDARKGELQKLDIVKKILEMKNINSIDTVSELERVYMDAVKSVTQTPEKDRPGSIGSGTKEASFPIKEPAKEEKKPVFTDLGSVSWAEESIMALTEKGIITGVGDGRFAPNDKLTREQLVKILVGAMNLKKTEGECPFTDVEKGSFYYDYIVTAYESGIINGVSEHEFGIGHPVSREQLCTMIYRAVSWNTIPEERDSIVFSDDKEISGYAREAVYGLYRRGIINGMGDNLFLPKDTATRAQGTKIIYELMKRGDIE